MPMGEDPRHGLLVALVVALVGVLLLIFAALAIAPVLVIVLGLMMYVVWWYVSREDTSYMHHAQEHENRFWTTVAFCFSGALVFVHDSPVALGQWSPVLGFLFVMMFTFSVHSYDRQLHRSRIGRAPNFRSSVESSTMLHSNVQDKCRRISVCLSKLDNRLVATNLNHMLWADMVQNLEKEIVNILSDADPGELNYMLPKIGLGLLFYKVKDHAPINLHRTRLLNVLADTRISDLNVTSRALVLDALQQLKLSAHKDSEAYAKKIILKTKGDELSELKSLTDAKGDIHSLHKLVYRDIKDVAIREEVLKHIANQARVQAAHMRLGTRTGTRRGDKAWRKILSDVDDTLTSSGGRFPAGVDARYPKKSVYPGVLDFYRELDLGVNGPSEWPKGQLGNLVFLSARPHVYKDMSESKSYAKFKWLQDEKGLYSSPTLLAGSIDTGTTMLLTGNMEPIAEKKFQNFAEYVSLYPEFKHVFVGDNGQGDVRAAEMMVDRYPGKLEAVYVHRVVAEEKTFGYQGEATRDKWKKANIVFVGDYVEAACHAYSHGLIQAVGLQRVCQGAVEQFVDMKFEGPLERELQRRQINQSVWKANKLLQAANLEPNWLIRAVRAFDDMEAVLTPFGRGTVVNFRPEDGVYEVLLDWSQKVSASAASRKSVNVKASTAPVTPLTTQSGQQQQQQRPPGLSEAASPASTPSRPVSFGGPATGGLIRPPLPASSSSTPSLLSLLPAPSPSPPATPSVAAPAGHVVGVPASAALPAPLAGGGAMAGGGVGGGAEALGAAAAGGSEGNGGVDNNIDNNDNGANPGLLLPAPGSSVMPQRGPDAAGGGEAFTDARVRNATHSAVAATAAASGAAAAATAAIAVTGVGGGGGAEEAAGAPAAPAALEEEEGAPSTPLPPRGGDPDGEESLAEQEARAAAAAALTEAAAEAVHGHQGNATAGYGDGPDETAAAAAAAGNSSGMVRPQSAGATLGGHGAFSPPGGPDASWEPASEGADTGGTGDVPRATPGSVAAAAAKVLAANNPESMAVRAYLQLPSLKKAPPEVKKVKKDEGRGDEPKSGRLSTRLSIFSRQNQNPQQQQQDAGSAGSAGRSAAKIAIAKGVVVQTFLGPATVRKVRTEDGMCEVSFRKWPLANGKPAFGVFHETNLVADAAAAATVGKSPSLFGRTGKAISSLFKLSAVPAPAPLEPRVGDIVDTIFGPAAVTAVRGGAAAAAGLSTPDKATATAAAAAAAGAEPARKKDQSAAGVAGAEAVASAAPAAAAGSDGSGPAPTPARSPSPSRLRRAVTPLSPSGSASRSPFTPPRPAHDHSSQQQQQQQQQQRTPPRSARTPPRPVLPSSLPPTPSSPAAPSSHAAAVDGPLPLPLPPPPTPSAPVFGSLPPLSPLPPSSARFSRRPRGASVSVPGRDNYYHQPRRPSSFSSSSAGELLPGQLLSSPACFAGSRVLEQQAGRRVSAPPSPAAAAFDGAESDVDSGEDGGGGEDDDGEATSPLGIRILERRGEPAKGGKRTAAASPTDAVMYEVAFMKWRLSNNTPARAVLNRASIWAEWEQRPPSMSARAASSSGRRRSSRRRSGSGRQSTRPSSFFGFMSMVGGYAGGGTTTKILETPTGSPRKSGGVAKSPGKGSALAAAVPLLHPCEFPPGACVQTTGFGPALVTKFRPEDGIYQVSLLLWRMRSSGGGGLATGFLARKAISSTIAVPGAAVLTALGPATVQAVREDGVAVVVAGVPGPAGGSAAPLPAFAGDRVRAPPGGATMFLQLSAILGLAKATLGERVRTALGWGVVRAYHAASDTYVVDLGWGIVHSPGGDAIKERRPLTEATPLARSSGGIIKLFRWPLFGSGPSGSAAPFPPIEI